MSRIRTYRMSDNDDIFFEENNLNWTKEVKRMIDRLRVEIKGNTASRKREQMRGLVNDLIVFFFGVMCLGLSYVVLNLIVYVILNIAALVAIGAGLYLFIREFINTYISKE